MSSFGWGRLAEAAAARRFGRKPYRTWDLAESIESLDARKSPFDKALFHH